jgi:hypothetical protein
MEITTEQRFSVKGLNYLATMLEDSEWVRDNEIDEDTKKCIETLKKTYIKKKKVSDFASRKVIYKTSNQAAGKLGYGRLYGSAGSLERLWRKMRGTLCKDLYYDVDIKNCQPTLLVQFAKMKYDYDLPETQKYCDNRDEYLAAVSDIKDEAKAEILKCIFNGSVKHDILLPMKAEIMAFAIHIANKGEFPDLFAISSQTNIFGSYLSLILQTVEKHVMISMKTAFEVKKYSVDILAYDGVMIRQAKGNKPTDEILESVQKTISDETHYDVKLAIKEMESFDLPDDDDDDDAIVETEVVPGVKLSEFMAMKEEFEKQFFFYNINFSIANFRESKNEITFMTKEQARDYFKATKYNFNPFGRGDPVPFFDIWFNRLDRRSIDYITYKETTDPLAFYQPVRFAYQKEGPINEDAREFFMDLINITSNGEEPLKQYLLSYLAHLIQKPFDLPGTALVLTGSQGTGKDTLFDFIGNKVLGEYNFADYSDNGQFFDHYDTKRAGKFLSKLQEADAKYCKPNASKLKGLITAKTLDYNPKGKPSFQLPNCLRQIFTTNKENPFQITDGERRYVMYSVSREKQGDHDYWTRLNRAFNAEGAGYTVGKLLMEYDISNFNPAVLPDNKYFNMLKEVTELSDETFLKSDDWNGQPCNISHLFNLYQTFCQNSNLEQRATNTYGLKNVMMKHVNNKRYVDYKDGQWFKI